MTLPVSIPGRPDLRLEHLLLDVNGTLTNRGVLLDVVKGRLERLRDTTRDPPGLGGHLWNTQCDRQAPAGRRR